MAIATDMGASLLVTSMACVFSREREIRYSIVLLVALCGYPQRWLAMLFSWRQRKGGAGRETRNGDRQVDDLLCARWTV